MMRFFVASRDCALNSIDWELVAMLSVICRFGTVECLSHNNTTAMLLFSDFSIMAANDFYYHLVSSTTECPPGNICNGQ